MAPFAVLQARSVELGAARSLRSANDTVLSNLMQQRPCDVPLLVGATDIVSPGPLNSSQRHAVAAACFMDAEILLVHGFVLHFSNYCDALLTAVPPTREAPWV